MRESLFLYNKCVLVELTSPVQPEQFTADSRISAYENKQGESTILISLNKFQPCKTMNNKRSFGNTSRIPSKGQRRILLLLLSYENGPSYPNGQVHPPWRDYALCANFASVFDYCEM